MGVIEREITEEMIKEKIKELKPKYQQLATNLEGIHIMSLEDTVRVLILHEGVVEWILKVRASRLLSTQNSC